MRPISVMQARGPTATTPWTPSMESTLKHNFDFSLAAYLSINAGTVETASDQTGSGVNLTATGSERPAWNSTGLNGLGIATFDGTDDRLQATGLTRDTFKNKGGGMIVTVHKTSSGLSSVARVVFAAAASGATRATVYSTHTSGSYATAGGRRLDADTFQVGGSTGVNNTPNFEIFAAEFDFTNALLRQYVNGTLGNTTNPFQTAGATSNTNIVQMVLGANAASAQYLNGAIAHVLVFDSWSDALRQRCEGYFAHLRGLAGNLPGGHPYKSAPPYV